MAETGVKLSDTQIQAIRSTYKQFDKKGDDKMKVNDLSAAMKAVGHSVKSEWLEKMEEFYDVDDKGYVSYAEFETVVRKKMQADEDERELREIFRVLDKDKRGEVNVDELRWILKNLGDDLTEEDIDDMIADVDTDGSGWVDYNEFCNLMMND